MLRTDARVGEWIARAKAVSIEDAAAFVGAVLKPPHAPERCGACPFCGGHDRFSINVKKGVFNCRGTEGGGPIDLVMHCRGTDFLTACEVLTGEPRPQGAREESDFERQARETKIIERQEAAERSRIEQENKEATNEEREAAQIEKTLVAMRPVAGTHAEKYLRARGIIPASAMTEDLGFAELPYWGYADVGATAQTLLATVPALLAIHRSADGKIVGVRRTYLDPVEPAKFRPWNPPSPERPRNAAKKMLGNVAGSLIRLGRTMKTLAVAEGIETALSWYALGYGGEDVSIAAAGDLGNLSGGCAGSIPHPSRQHQNGRPVMVPNGIPSDQKPGFFLPYGVENLVLIGDGDSDPISTKVRILAAARRHRARGVEVRVHMATNGYDWNDILMAKVRAEAA